MDRYEEAPALYLHKSTSNARILTYRFLKRHHYVPVERISSVRFGAPAKMTEERNLCKLLETQPSAVTIQMVQWFVEMIRISLQK